jgi:hypothetical protein
MSVFLNSTSAVISEGNSSTTNLAAGNSYTFTGTAERTAHPDLMLNLYCDQITAISIQFSQDGTNWDSTLSKIGAAGVNEFTTAVKGFRYVRVIVSTASLTTTIFRLQTQFGLFRQGNASLNATTGLDADALVVRPSNFNYEVALSRRLNATTWNKFGYNGDLDIGTETIRASGGLFVPLTSPSGITVVSSSANDTAGGTGAQSIVVYAVDSNRLATTFVVALNGTTPVVVSTDTFNGYGINRAAIYLAGSSGINAGLITITSTTGAVVQTTIPIGEGTTQHAYFFTQAGHTFLTDWLWINCTRLSGAGAQPTITVKGWVTSLVSGAKYLVYRQVMDTAVENTVELRPSQPFVIGEKSLLTFEATTDVNNTEISCRFSGIEIKN